MGGFHNALHVAAAAATSRSPPSSSLVWPRAMCNPDLCDFVFPNLVSLELNGYGSTGLEKLPGGFMSRLRRLALVGVADATPLQVVRTLQVLVDLTSILQSNSYVYVLHVSQVVPLSSQLHVPPFPPFFRPTGAALPASATSSSTDVWAWSLCSPRSRSCR